MINKKYTHVFRPAALALLVALAAACGKDSPIAPDPDHGQGTPIAIGQLPVAAAAADPNDAAGTYWKNGDAIFVTATNADPDVPVAPEVAAAPNPNAALTAVYIYNGSSWAPDGTPLYVEHISTAPSYPITIESWDGKPSQGTAGDPYTYTDQSDPESAPAGYTSGDRYRRNDYLLCPAATLNTRTLSGKLTHSRVDLVLNIADYTDADADGNALNTLPDNAVLKLNDGSNPAQTVITAYREGKTSGGNTPGTTTFRAYIDLEDVPGITGITSGSGSLTAASGTVGNGSLLGTLTYTMSGSSAPKTLKIRYSITSGTDADGNPGASGTDVAIKAGKRITVSATFADPSYLDATASLKDWEDIDAGEAGTGDINMVEKKDDAGQPIYEIYSAQGLKKFVDLVNGTGDYAAGKNASANVRLMADIDLSTVCSATLGKSWEPIGTNLNPYAGCFDGQGYTVKGLYIKDKDTNYTGLFGVIGQNGVIRRLRVEAEQISSSAPYTGVLAGWNKGTITACQATGDVAGADYTGGLIGTSGGTITACYATGNATGSDCVGGLMGYNSGTITACCATGNASGTNNIGGLVGYNDGTITACYATGNVAGADYTGGLVGFNDTGISGILQHCATTQPTICKGNPSTGCQSGLTSFSAIRAIVASEAAQNAWKKSIGTDGLILNNDTGRVLNAPWDDPSAPTNARAIWKTPADGTTTPGDQITGGHLQLWWQPNP